MSSDLERKLIDSLDDSVDALDELTVARLRSARLRALDALDQSHAHPRRWWLVPAACAVAVLALTLDLPGGSPPPTVSVEADAELLADLDLVLWLEETDGTL